MTYDAIFSQRYIRRCPVKTSEKSSALDFLHQQKFPKFPFNNYDISAH